MQAGLFFSPQNPHLEIQTVNSHRRNIGRVRSASLGGGQLPVTHPVNPDLWFEKCCCKQPVVSPRFHAVAPSPLPPPEERTWKSLFHLAFPWDQHSPNHRLTERKGSFQASLSMHALKLLLGEASREQRPTEKPVCRPPSPACRSGGCAAILACWERTVAWQRSFQC